jgi:hypothetical protein
MPTMRPRAADHFVQGRDLELAVLGLVAVRHGLLGAQLLDLGQGEVAGEPIGGVDAVDLAGGLARREFRTVGDVGRAAQHRLVTGDQHTVLGHHEVGLDEVGTQLDGELVAFEGVFREIPAGAAMGDHGGSFAGQRLLLGLGCPEQRGQRDGECTQNRNGLHGILFLLDRSPAIDPVTFR